MKNRLPTGANPLAPLPSLHVEQITLSQILDFGRYIIRLDPAKGRGYYESQLKVNREKGDLRLVAGRMVADEALPPQVAIALQRAGYAV